jgi:AmiR/NasT family two-component response regulator
VLVEQLTHALDSRIVLEQAKGMLAEQGRVGLDDAFERLRRYARDHNLELASVAQRVIARQLSFADLEGRAG